MELGGGISCSYGIRALPAESLVSESGRTLSILCTRNCLQSMGQRAGPPMGGIKRRLHAELRYAVLDTSLNQYILAPRGQHNEADGKSGTSLKDLSSG